MAKKKTGTLKKVGRSVKHAAKVVAATADEYLVEPVGKALGLKKKRATKRTAGKARAATRTGAARKKTAPSKGSVRSRTAARGK